MSEQPTSESQSMSTQGTQASQSSNSPVKWTEENYERLAEIFSALSNPGRLKVLHLLSNLKEPMTNNSIMMLLQLNQSQTSNYLKDLADAGLVKRQPAGNYVLHSVNDQGIDKIVFVLLNFKREPKVVSK